MKNTTKNDNSSVTLVIFVNNDQKGIAFWRENDERVMSMISLKLLEYNLFEIVYWFNSI
jgi:hypothetical protein